MTAKELIEKTDAELEREAAELRGKLRDFRFQIASRQLKDVRDVRDAKRDLARVLTVRRQRQLKAAKAAPAAKK